MNYHEIKLKPCPFCGSQAIVNHINYKELLQGYVVECSNGDCLVSCIDKIYDTMEQAIEKWNRRTNGCNNTMITFTDKDKHFAEIVLRTLIENRSEAVLFFSNERDAIIKALLLALGDNIPTPFDFLADLISSNDGMNETVPCNSCQKFDCYMCYYHI